jgi:hypothetical protein
MGRPRGVEDAAPYNALLPFLLRFQLLLLSDILLQLALAPAVDLGLLGALDAQRTGGHIMADGGAGSRERMVADGDGCDQVRVAADERIVADGRVELALAVVVAGDGAAAEVAVLAHRGITDVGQMADCVALGKVGILRFDISAQMAALGGFGADAHMGEGADLVVGADVAPIALAGIDRGPGVNDGILQQGVGADDAVRADDRLAAQDAARQDGRTGGNDDLRLNADVITDKIHAVIQMALKRGGIALLCQLEILSCGRHIAVLPLYTHFVPAAHGGCRRTLYLWQYRIIPSADTPKRCLRRKAGIMRCCPIYCITCGAF